MFDYMFAQVAYHIVAVAGGKKTFDECRIFNRISEDGSEHGYVYGPGDTLVSEEPKTDEELIEQTAHLQSMKNKMRGFIGGSHG